MTDFNMWTWNSRVFPGIDPLPVRLGDRVRVRMGNLSMTNHPIHLHGHHFVGDLHRWRLGSRHARWPEATIDVPVGTIRAIEFIADNPGDWPFHCHKSHHTMNAMGHNVRNFIGAEIEARSCGSRPQARTRIYADGLVWNGRHGRDGRCRCPDNTLPMMSGDRPIRPGRDGRHVHRHQDPRRPRRQ